MNHSLGYAPRVEEKNICARTKGLESGRVAYVDWFGPTRVEPLTFPLEGRGGRGNSEGLQEGSR
jgi:hypothetical protein